MTESPASGRDVVTDFVQRAAETTSHALAVTDGIDAVSYSEMRRRAMALASRLGSAGLVKGELVTICLPRSVSQLVATLAVWMAGGACMPVDPAWPDERLSLLLADADCAIVVCGSGAVDRAAFAPSRAVLAYDRESLGSAECANAAANQPDDLAYVIYTSGSTGRPNGVEITHANLANLIEWHNDAFAVTPETRAAYVSSIGFDAGFWEVWPYLSAGASVSIVPDLVRTSPSDLLNWLVDERITCAFAPTLLAEQLIRLEWPERSALRFLLTGADTLTSRPSTALPFVLVNNYGPTESTVVATSGRVAAASATMSQPPIGRAISNCVIHLLDADGNPVAPGEIGELYIGGAGVGRGYRGQPALTAERFVPDRFSDREDGRLYRTGDLGSLDEDGEIRFHGRRDEQVKIRGHRVEPEEVATVLRQHSLVAEATVVARKAADDSDELVAYLATADSLLTSEAVRAYLASRLPDYLIPASFVRLAELPVTHNGKLDKRALPTPAPCNQLLQNAFAQPTTPIERRLAEILAAVMNRDEVGADDNFFLLGGHSLLGTQIVLRAGEAFGVDLTLRDLFDAPTIKRLAKVIEQRIVETVAAMSDDQAIQLVSASA